MDGKKQTNLTPELKEIYDRVMNTSAGSKTPTAPSSLPTTPPAANNPLPPTPAPSPSISIPTAPETADEALTSSPPRPVSAMDGTKPFSFSGTAHTTEEANGTAKKKGLSLSILILLGIVFVSVWTFFCLVIFGFIKL